jgi:predicted ATPase
MLLDNCEHLLDACAILVDSLRALAAVEEWVHKRLKD